MSEDRASTGRVARAARWLGLGTLVAVLVSSPWWVRTSLREMAFFRVRHIEVRGTRYASPSEVARTLGIDTTRSLWDDTGVLEAKVRSLPSVRDVDISRRLPSTLVVTIEEHIPVAMVSSAQGFQGFDDEGRALRFDPSRALVDVPVIARRDTAILRLLGEVRSSDPSLFARISEVRRVGRDELLMQLVSIPVRTMADVTVDQLAQIAPVQADLATRHARPFELDLRFKDQVIARIQ